MKIAFFCGQNDSFIKPIILRLSQEHDVKQFKADTIQAMYNMMNWSDVSWFEWCEPLLNAGIRIKAENRLTTRLINRIHSYEIFTDLPGQIDWRYVDDVVFVAEHIKEIACNRFKRVALDSKVHVIHNGVDMNKFTLQEHGHGYNIGYAGYINHKKNPGLLLDVLTALKRKNKKWILHLAGQHQEQRIQLYMEQQIKTLKLEKKFVWHGWVKDMPDFWSQMNYAINTSYLESFCYGIAEPMACGVKPLIHDFIGARGLYPAEYIWSGIHQIHAMLKHTSNYEPEIYRQVIDERYNLGNQVEKINELIKGV